MILIYFVFVSARMPLLWYLIDFIVSFKFYLIMMKSLVSYCPRFLIYIFVLFICSIVTYSEFVYIYPWIDLWYIYFSLNTDCRTDNGRRQLIAVCDAVYEGKVQIFWPTPPTCKPPFRTASTPCLASFSPGESFYTIFHTYLVGSYLVLYRYLLFWAYLTSFPALNRVHIVLRGRA